MGQIFELAEHLLQQVVYDVSHLLSYFLDENLRCFRLCLYSLLYLDAQDL